MTFYQKMSSDSAKCLLCPHLCEIQDGESGRCRARENKAGEIVPSGYGMISSMAVEPIEKKPFIDFLPGTKTLSIGSWSCNLSCKYCENHQISQVEVNKSAKFFSVKEVVDIAIDKGCSSVCMTYNEPTIQIEYLFDLSKACHEKHLKFIIKTNAYLNIDPWIEVCKAVDAMNIDYKGDCKHFEYITGCYYINYKQRIDLAVSHRVHVELSIPIMPGFRKDNSYFEPLSFLADCKNVFNLHCHLLKIYPAHLMIDSLTTSDEDIEKAKEALYSIFPKDFLH
jgi:pyruvate formate lyase activating enzyme